MTPSQLRRTIAPGHLSCDTVDQLKPIESIIGQDRAVKALQFGLGIRSHGFNIYVSGQPGTGKLTAVKRYLSDIARREKTPDDWCYVHNFDNPYEPKRLRLPPGRGAVFKNDMARLIVEARQALIKAFESEEFAAKKEDIIKDVEQKKQNIFRKVERLAQESGFLIKHAPGHITTIPLKDGEAMTDEEFQSLPDEKKTEIISKQEKLFSEIKAAMRQDHELEREANAKVKELEELIALFAIKILIDELKEKYSKTDEVVKYLEQVQNDILDNLIEFLKPPKAEGVPPFVMHGWAPPFFTRYEVNVLVDNAGMHGAPVVIELNPTYNNLVGRVEKESQMGMLYTDFTLIRKGSLHQANGGYIIIAVEDLLRNFQSWESLKRAIRNKEIVIEDLGERLGLTTSKTLKPQPVPFDAKVILIGEPLLYYLLYEYDNEFRELFKVKAEFDTSMDFTEENFNNYLSFICKVCQEENHTLLDNTALAKLVEYGCRLAKDQQKLSTCFGELTDIIREGDYYARQQQSRYITSEHIQKAIEEKFYRSNLIQEKITEMIQRGIIVIEHQGAAIGQVNGLAVSDVGDVTFARPNRITVTTGIGADGVIDIEREAKLGGKIHTKGVMILSGFLSEKFARHRPLSLSARLVFEQSYSEVEGDSASSTELYALLSSLSGVPIKQGIAVTGSVNQKGEVQAIGAVNEKIEGFYEVCRQKGFTGEQGVMIPQSNLSNLMLKEEVVEAVKKKKFHIWAVSTVDEGIEVLTGVKAGKRLQDGSYEKDSVYYKADQRLKEIAEAMEKRMPHADSKTVLSKADAHEDA